MKAPRKWMNNNMIRSILPLIGMRGPFELHKDDALVPYFQYRIGPYQNDHYLYFPHQPNKFEYRGEIFSKMYEYRGFDLVKYIEFHYEAYPDKDEFVRFLRFEVVREMRALRKYRFVFWVRFPRWKAILETSSLWVEAEEKRLQVRVAESSLVPERAPEELGPGKEKLLDMIQNEMSMILQAFMGRIELYNEHHVTKLIQLLRILQDLRSPGRKGVALFKTFSDMDMAAVLRQLVLFGDKKINTLQVKIAEVGRDMDLNDPAMQKLAKALQDFFF